jgi:hypothetical protein
VLAVSPGWKIAHTDALATVYVRAHPVRE